MLPQVFLCFFIEFWSFLLVSSFKIIFFYPDLISWFVGLSS
jgi:hypothetical protein